MFWVLKRTVSLRQFFWVPTTYVLVENQISFFYHILLSGGLRVHRVCVTDCQNETTQEKRVQAKTSQIRLLLGKQSDQGLCVCFSNLCIDNYDGLV